MKKSENGNSQFDQALDQLIKKIKDPKELEFLQDQLFKRGIQTLLKAEMTAHHGYENG